MIDDERLQELLSKASSLYNNGEYKGAIQAWQEALGVDPGSQKAKEGIRMATLLLGDWEPAAGGAAPEESAPLAAPGDGGGAAEADLSPEEVEAQIDLGVARIKQLLAQRKYAEAIEGARGLLPINPKSEEVQRLLEQAQHAFESAPFIQEHLTLARELMAQDRYPEAETECKKVFTLDATHPEARTLLAQIREKIQGHLKRAADQLGGMTVKLSLPEVLAGAKSAPSAPAAAKPAAAAPAAAKAQDPPRGFTGEIELDAGDDPSIPIAGQAPDIDGAEAARQEEVTSRNALKAAFEQAGVLEEPHADAGTAPADATAAESGGPALAGSHEPAGAPPQVAEPHVVEARTVVPPTVRVVPRTPPAATPKPPPLPPQAAAPKPPPLPAGRGAAAKPPSPKPDPKAAPSIAVAKPAPADEAAWETELTQLNIKQGERDILRGTPAKVGTAPSDDQADADLMSFLDSDLGGLPETPSSGTGQPEAPTGGALKPGPAPSGGGKGAKPVPEPAPAKAIREKPRPRPKATAAPAASEIPMETTEEKPHSAPRSGPKPRSSAPKYFALLGLLIVAGGAAAWWFLFQPRSAGGAGTPGQPAAPPGGSSSGAIAAQPQGAIPTPIGATSRQPSAQDPQAPSPQSGSGAGVSGTAAPATGASGTSAPGASAPGTGASGPGSSAPTGQQPGNAAASTASAGGAPAPQTKEPIKPPTPPLSPAEIRQKVAAYTSDGRRLSAEGKWREARAKLSAALALDPANFDIKDLLDKAQAKIDAEQSLQDEFDSAKKAYNDKDYEVALRKFYRLPRDKGLGDIDRYIRNAWFNWAVVGLKAGNATDALQKLKELLDVDPGDAEALKLQEVAEHYVSRAKDKVYYAFVDNLKLREYDQK